MRHLNQSLPLLLLATAGLAQAPLEWRTLAHLPVSLAAFDAPRNRTVFVTNEGRYRQFDWDGMQAVERLNALAGTQAMGWLFENPRAGELLAVRNNAIYRYDGVQWLWAGANTSIVMQQMAFDDHRQRLVGIRASLGSLVEWDGFEWLQVTPPGGPGPRTDAAFAYDPAGQRCILYGGTAGQPQADCWAWDGSFWTQLAANGAPGPRSNASLAANANGQLVLYGGSSSTQTFVLVGNAFQAVTTAHDPGPRAGARLVRDPLGLLLFGGSAASLDAWRFDGTDWAPLGLSLDSPRLNAFSAVAFDRARGQAVLLANSIASPAATWLYDTAWRATTPTVHPSPRSAVSMAWSAIDQRVIAFGGLDGNNVALQDTWAWTGSDWLQLQPATIPAARYAAQLNEDPRGGVQLCHGLANLSHLTDQYFWNGSDWVADGSGPIAVMPGGSSSCYDEARQRIVLTEAVFGGVRTHEWDGVQWTVGTLQGYVPGPSTGRIAYDPKRQAVIALNSLAQWNGSTWQALPGAAINNSLAIATVDHARQRLLRFDPSLVMVVAEAVTTQPTATTYGSACSFGPGPATVALGEPRLGNQQFALVVGTRRPAAPAFLVLGFGTQGTSVGNGCSLWVGNPLATHFALADQGGELRYALPLPASPALLDVHLTAQGAVFDPAASPLGSVTLSAGLDLRLGD